MPDDIIRLIFDLAFPMKTKRCRARTLLGHVCKRHRDSSTGNAADAFAPGQYFCSQHSKMVVANMCAHGSATPLGALALGFVGTVHTRLLGHSPIDDGFHIDCKI